MFPFFFAPQPEGGRQERRRKRRSSSSSVSRRCRRHGREERGRSRRRARSSTSPSERKGKKRSRDSPVRDLPPARAGYAWVQVPYPGSQIPPPSLQAPPAQRDGRSKTGSQRPRGRDGSTPPLHGRGMDSRHGTRVPSTRPDVPVNGSISSHKGTRVGTNGTTPRPARKARGGLSQRPHIVQRDSLRPLRHRLKKTIRTGTI